MIRHAAAYPAWGHRKAAFAKEPTGANQVWQLDFSEIDHDLELGGWAVAESGSPAAADRAARAAESAVRVLLDPAEN